MRKIRAQILVVSLAIGLRLISTGLCGGDDFGFRPDRPDLGTIIVYRPWSIIGAPISTWRFNLNHGRSRLIGNGTYCRLSVLPGYSTISHDDVPFISEDPQTVHVRAKETVYFEYTAQLSLIFEVADDQEKAAGTVRKLAPMQNLFALDEENID